MFGGSTLYKERMRRQIWPAGHIGVGVGQSRYLACAKMHAKLGSKKIKKNQKNLHISTFTNNAKISIFVDLENTTVSY